MLLRSLTSALNLMKKLRRELWQRYKLYKISLTIIRRCTSMFTIDDLL